MCIMRWACWERGQYFLSPAPRTIFFAKIPYYQCCTRRASRKAATNTVMHNIDQPLLPPSLSENSHPVILDPLDFSSLPLPLAAPLTVLILSVNATYVAYIINTRPSSHARIFSDIALPLNEELTFARFQKQNKIVVRIPYIVHTVPG